MFMRPFYHSSSFATTPKELLENGLILDMDSTESIGARLRRLRKLAHLTQTALAVRVGLTQGAVGNIETGERGYGGSVVGFARALHTSPEYLLLETNDPAPRAKIAVLDPQSELDLQPAAPEPITAVVPLSPEAELLGRWFDKIPESLGRLRANQTCLQAIIDALQQDQRPANTPAQPADAKKQSA